MHHAAAHLSSEPALAVEWRASVVGLRRLRYHLELKLELAGMPRNVRRCEEFSCSASDLLAVLTSTELLQEQQRLQGARNVSGFSR